MFHFVNDREGKATSIINIEKIKSIHKWNEFVPVLNVIYHKIYVNGVEIFSTEDLQYRDSEFDKIVESVKAYNSQ